LDLTLQLSIGDSITGATALATATGLQDAAPYDIVVQSTPVSVGSGNVPIGGAVSKTVNLPPGLEAGWHRITFTSTYYTGDPALKTLWFRIDSIGTLLEISSADPGLARTGFDPNATSQIALAALIAGLGFLLISRRSRTRWSF